MNQYYNNTNFDNFNSSNQFMVKFVGVSLIYCVSLLVLSSIVILKIKKKHPKLYMIIERQV
jgi:hypothetical protein